MFRWLRWYLAKARLAATPWSNPPGRVTLLSLPQRKRVHDFFPNADPYSKLSAFWEQYAEWYSSDYGRFLGSAQKYYGFKISSVLDLACGTGLLTRRIARIFDSVVGLDISQDMLNEAARRSESQNIRFVLGDFRDFRLGQLFDAVVCAGDSLNYVQNPDEIRSVFRCVYRQLSSDGVFVFDALNQRACRNLRHTKTVVTLGDEQFMIYFFYNPEINVCEDLVVFRDCVEKHRRVPIEKSQVQEAAKDSGFEVAESFATSIFSNVGFRRHFYVLRKP
jgi:ubiquinone/menaquinone biosynthesis C-methylase UbiE